MRVEEILEGVGPSVQEELELWGYRFSLAEFLGLDCSCGRTECPGLKLSDLHHVCFDLRNAAGNVHREITSGLPWVEFHMQICLSVLNHVGRQDWYRFGLSEENYRRAICAMSAQEVANAGKGDDGLWNHHISFQIPGEMIDAAKNPEKVAIFARSLGLSQEDAAARLEYIMAWSVASMIAARGQVTLNHEAVNRYGSPLMLRLWKGDLSVLGELRRRFEDDPFYRLPMMKKGRIVGVEGGSLPALNRYLGREELPEGWRPVLDKPRELRGGGDG